MAASAPLPRGHEASSAGPASAPLPAFAVLRPIGAPLTVGLAGLGIASLVDSSLGLGWVPSDETTQVGIVLLAVPFLLQMLASIFSYLARDGATGAAVGVLSATWLVVGILHVYSGSTARDATLGMLLLGAGAMVAVSAAATGLANPLAGAAFGGAALRFLLDAVYELGGPTAWQHVAAIVGLVVAGIVLYAVPAFELEGQRRRPVLPTLRRGRGRLAVTGTAADQLAGLEHEAGVRGMS